MLAPTNAGCGHPPPARNKRLGAKWLREKENTVKEKVITAIIGGALLSGALLGSGTASASELSFLQTLNESGLNVYDAATAVNSGYLICANLRLGSSYSQEAWSLVRGAYGGLGRGAFSYSDGMAQVRAAHNELCPSVYAYKT